MNSGEYLNLSLSLVGSRELNFIYMSLSIFFFFNFPYSLVSWMGSSLAGIFFCEHGLSTASCMNWLGFRVVKSTEIFFFWKILASSSLVYSSAVWLFFNTILLDELLKLWWLLPLPVKISIDLDFFFLTVKSTDKSSLWSSKMISQICLVVSVLITGWYLAVIFISWLLLLYR